MSAEAEYQSMVRGLPCWHGEIRASRLLGGLSNVAFKVIDEVGTYVARCGSDVPIHNVSREVEHHVSIAAASLGISPRVHYSAPHVLVLEFLGGKTLNQSDVGKAAARLGALLARVHSEMPTVVGNIHHYFDVFDTTRRYYSALQEAHHSSVSEMRPYVEMLASIEQALIKLPHVLGHHDLLPANIIEDAGRLWLIDWEFAGYGSPLFDLANLSSNNEFSIEQDQILLNSYFNEPLSEPLLQSFFAMKVTSTLRELLWALVSKVYVKNEGVDYDAHCREYRRRLEDAISYLRSRNDQIL